jgi:adenine-specific DNA-methyltransferase
MMTGSSLDYLACFLNSKIFRFTFKDYFPELLGETREVRKVFFETITVRPTENEQWYEMKLNSIFENKSKGLPTADIEDEIDQRIFDLYELTDAERSVLNNSFGGIAASEAYTKSMSVTVSE